MYVCLSGLLAPPVPVRSARTASVGDRVCLNLMGLTWIYIVKLVIMLVHLTTQRDHICVNARRS
jgi:hypothetical protein